MKKYIVKLLAAALVCLNLFACGGDAPAGEIVLDDVAESLLDAGSFTDALAPIDDDTIAVLYGVEGALDQVVYIGSGATPEEIALFSFSTAAEAEAGFALAQMRIADQKNAFSDYNSWEMPKLDAAVVKQYGTYVAVCVSGDSKAEAVLAETFGK